MWRELGELRLLHLLEDPSIIRSLLGLLDTSDVVFPLNKGTNQTPTDTNNIDTVPINNSSDGASCSDSKGDALGHLSSITATASSSTDLSSEF